MITRTGKADDTLEKFAEAVAKVGLELIQPADDESSADAYLVRPGERPMPVEIKRSSLISANGLSELLQRWDRQRPGDAIRVVVADRITTDARQLLREAGWGWFDLRGHLRLAAKGLLVDADIERHTHRSRRTEPFAGNVGLEVAAAMLLDPYQRIGIRQIANQIGRAASSVSDTVKALREAGLITKNDLPRTPELFWELASAWKSSHIDVAVLPQNDRGTLGALRVNLHNLEQPGWALSDTRAAAVYGAPVAVRSDHPLEFYVPDERVLRRATQLLGLAPEHPSRAATLRAAPISLVCASRQDPVMYETNLNADFWPLAQPLFVALDLAQDPGRGREVLNDWVPPKPWSRVW